MGDVSTELLTLGGVVIGAAASQIGSIVQAVSKGKSRKRKAEAQERAAKSARWRELYSEFTSALRDAAHQTKLAFGPTQSPGAVAGDRRTRLHTDLTSVRDLAGAVQVDGTEEARKVATDVLDGIADLLEAVIQQDAISKATFENTLAVLTKAVTDMITVSRKDFGADAG
jgi:hypothetical protein